MVRLLISCYKYVIEQVEQNVNTFVSKKNINSASALFPGLAEFIFTLFTHIPYVLIEFTYDVGLTCVAVVVGCYSHLAEGASQNVCLMPGA